MNWVLHMPPLNSRQLDRKTSMGTRYFTYSPNPPNSVV